MSNLAMIYGQSGSGKTSALRNFTNDEVAVISVSGKPLPFRSELKTLNPMDSEKKSLCNYSRMAAENQTAEHRHR